MSTLLPDFRVGSTQDRTCVESVTNQTIGMPLGW